MVHRHREEVRQRKTRIKVREAPIQTARLEVLTGEAPLWPAGDSLKVPLGQPECPRSHSLFSGNHALPVRLVNAITMGLHRRGPRSPCVGCDGCFVGGDMTSLCLLFRALQSLRRLLDSSVSSTAVRLGSRPDWTIQIPLEYQNWIMYCSSRRDCNYPSDPLI